MTQYPSLHMMIDGERVSGGSRRTHAVINPATGETREVIVVAVIFPVVGGDAPRGIGITFQGEEPLALRVLREPQPDFYDERAAGGELSQALPDAIAACAKHFVGYGASESGRDYNTTNLAAAATRRPADAPPVFVFIHGLHKFKKLRHEDDFSFSSGDESASPGAQGAVSRNCQSRPAENKRSSWDALLHQQS